MKINRFSRTAARATVRMVANRRLGRCYSAPADASIPPEKRKYIPTTGYYPVGFQASSVHVGIKASNTKYEDLALVVSDIPCAAAGMFTRNRFKAAPVQVDRNILGDSQSTRGIRAVIANSGCANAVRLAL